MLSWRFLESLDLGGWNRDREFDELGIWYGGDSCESRHGI